MKKSVKILAMAMALAAAVACNSGNAGADKSNGKDSTAVAAKPVNPASLKPSNSLRDSVSYLLGVNSASMYKNSNINDVNYTEMRKGYEDYMKAKGNPRDSSFLKQFKINPMESNEIITRYIRESVAYTSAVNKEKEEKFLAQNRTKKDVKETASGLQYIISDAGEADKPGAKDTVYVHYRLTKTNGELIEEVKDESPSVKMRLNNSIPGWSEGIQLIGKGGKIKLFVPSNLGYGEQAMGTIEPNSTLVFDITLDSLRHYVAPNKDVNAGDANK